VPDAVPDAVSDGVALTLADSDALGSGVAPPAASAGPASLIVTSVATGLETDVSTSGRMPELTTTIRRRASEPRSYTPPAGEVRAGGGSAGRPSSARR